MVRRDEWTVRRHAQVDGPERSTIGPEGGAGTVRYCTALELVGRYLDMSHACRIHVLEVVDGFTVRFQTDPNTPTSLTTHLTHAALEEETRQPAGGRRRLTAPIRRRGSPAGYEAVLAALGHELDLVHAFSLLVDELDNALLVTYQFLRPSDGFHVRKRMVLLERDTIRAVLGDSRAQSARRAEGRLTLLAG